MDWTEDEPPEPNDKETIRSLFVEVAELLEAIVIAIQTEQTEVENEFVVREAIKRVVKLREHLSDAGYD